MLNLIIRLWAIPNLYEKFGYAGDFNIISHGLDLSLGKNIINIASERKIEIELRKVQTLLMGTCHLIQYKSLKNWDEKNGIIYVGSNITLYIMDWFYARLNTMKSCWTFYV